MAGIQRLSGQDMVSDGAEGTKPMGHTARPSGAPMVGITWVTNESLG